ncbi:MAG TPA: diguanylate cyclase [Acidobacteriaceae bacterium]|jgi:diguanylate cyclase (GGDEF)-like protein/PAS domain S-box-containing protein|nr:diguanylate cyclase [Acidobacteriaceae bacterium]
MLWSVPTREIVCGAVFVPSAAFTVVPGPSAGWPFFGLILTALVLAGLLAAWWVRRSTFPRHMKESFPGELAMLRTVLASVPDLIYVKDKKSHFLLANQGTADIMGAASGSELEGKSDFDYYDSEIAAGFYQDEQRIIATGQPLLSQDEHIEEPNGQTRYILTSKVPLRSAEGEIVGIIGIGRDITAIKETEGELKRARENLHYRATHDSLTALLNREAILDMLDRELARSQRERAPISVLLADLDHYKNVNDMYGHPVGDQVLREIARRFVHAVRAYDLVGRYGGEEFLLILGGCSATEAMARADQLRQSIEATPIPTSCGPLPITISIGVLPAQEWAYPPMEDVLREVDVSLYAAKAAGRNCCRLAAPPALI